MTIQNLATVFGPTLMRREHDNGDTVGKGVLVVLALLRYPATAWAALELGQASDRRRDHNILKKVGSTPPLGCTSSC